MMAPILPVVLILPIPLSRGLLEQHAARLPTTRWGPDDYQSTEHSYRPARRGSSRMRRLAWIGPRRIV